MYHREGRSCKWKELMKRVRKLVRNRASRYWDHQKRNLLAADAGRAFFKNVKVFNLEEEPPQFDIRSLFDPKLGDKAVAEKLADHFNGIISEFHGLDPTAVPQTYSSPVRLLAVTDVASRLKSIRKPKSMVKHDIFPSLVSPAACYLAQPLAHIYNTITTTGTWPMLWKQEFVIPKKATTIKLE